MIEFLKKGVPVLIILTTVSLIYLTYQMINREIIEIKNEPDQVRTYADIYDVIKKTTNREGNFWRSLDMAMDERATEKSAPDFSDTNIQVAGVQEADIIKTDGNYIYALTFQYLYIIKAENGQLEEVAKLEIGNGATGETFFEIYLHENKLIALKNIYASVWRDDNKMEDYYQGFNNSKIGVVVFDITDKANPKKESELSQSGYYLSSRMIGSKLYLISNYHVYDDIIEKEDETTFVPMVSNGEEKPIPIRDIYIMPNPISASYLTISGLDVTNSKNFVSVKSVLGSGSNIYASLENLYVATYDSQTVNKVTKSKTNIIKFSLKDGIIALTASESVDGYILNQFSMDEFDQYFRIVTTTDEYSFGEKDDVVSSIDTNNSKNNLYVLDSNLKVVGQIIDLAKDERVYSVRFDGNIGYFVTFRQVDPLFTVDLSNPQKPVILSELKIPGFSEYLHVYNENYLFGLGKEADDEGRILGMKISMFNISDKTNVTEQYKKRVGNEFTWSEASYNHKAILISPARDLIAFPAGNDYMVYTFNEDGFKQLAKLTFNEDEYFYQSLRGFYIDNHLYVLGYNNIASYDLETFAKTASLTLDETKPDIIRPY